MAQLSPDHHGMDVVMLGTAGGPLWRPSTASGHRSGISTAVVVDGAVYLIDCGFGVGQRIIDAGLKFTALAGIFITHHHSDHTIDLNSLMVMGGLTFRGSGRGPVDIFGPGPRGALPPVSPHATEEPDAIFPDNPTPGTADMVELLLRAHATDLNDRRRDSLAPPIQELFRGVDIQVPGHIGFHPNTNSHPEMEPFEVFADHRVRVTATLVQHQPVAPAFAFRFDSAYGSVTVSGDTAPSSNLVELARDTDLLLHEAIDIDGMTEVYAAAGRTDFRASMDHHRKAHTTPEDAGTVAAKAGAKALALHHLVPSTAPLRAWMKATETFEGRFLVPSDLDIIPIGR